MESSMLKSDQKNYDNDCVIYKPVCIKDPELVPKEGTDKGECFFLYFCALTADLVTFASGCSLVWSSPAIPKLKSSDPDINPLGVPITPFEESWIAALPPLGATFGPLLTGIFVDSYGRKNGLILLSTLKIISFVVLAFATDIHLYYAARFLLGVGVGMSYAILPSYIGEICDNHNRGKFGCIIGIFLTLGVLYAIAIGPLLSIKIFTLSCTVPLIFTIICLAVIIPESPVCLAARGRRKQARRALMKLRNTTEEFAEKDLLQILHLIDESYKSNKGGYLDICKIDTQRRALLICLGLCLLQQISGISPIMAFIEPIFSLTGSEIPPNVSAILVAVVQVLGMGIASGAVEKLGRRCLLIFSTIACGLSLGTLGVYFHLKQMDPLYVRDLFWLPVTTLIMFVFVFNIGLGSLPCVIISEMFPSNIRASAASLATASCALSSFAVTLFFPFLLQWIGAENCFCIFGGFCLIGAIFIYIGVPETKGKTIVEIQNILKKTFK